MARAGVKSWLASLSVWQKFHYLKESISVNNTTVFIVPSTNTQRDKADALKYTVFLQSNLEYIQDWRFHPGGRLAQFTKSLCFRSIPEI